MLGMPRETIAGLPRKEYFRQYRERMSQDPEWRAKRTEHGRKYRARHPEKAKELDQRARLRKYNLTLERYREMEAEQEGCCAACGGLPDARKTLYVDHDHACCDGAFSCGECVRALLCNGCNAALGHMKDDTERIQKLIDYLELQQVHGAVLTSA